MIKYLYLLTVTLFYITTAHAQSLNVTDLKKLFDLSDKQANVYLTTDKAFKLEYSKTIDGEINNQYSKETSNIKEYITIRQDPDKTIHQTLQYEIKPKSYADTIRKQLIQAGFNLRSAQNNFGMMSWHYLKDKCQFALFKLDNELFASIEVSER